MGFIKPNNNSGGSGGGLTPQELSRLNNAYTHSKSEHAPTTAEQNVQPDWNETDTTSDAYIKNKPDLSQIGSGGNIPSVTQVEPQELDMPKVFFYGTALPTTKDNVNLTMDYISNTTKFSSYIKLKCQGNSSMSYAKKNFTINMYSDEARATKLKKDFKGWGAQSKFCLKANYVDTTHTRNISGARIAYDMVASRPDSEFKQQLLQCPRNGAVDGFPIKLYFNGEFHGIYTWNIPKDTWMFNMDKSNPNHCVLCAEKNTDGNSSLINSCQFRQLWTNGDGQDWSVEVGTMSEDLRTKFNRCINFVMNATDQEFHDNIGDYFDLYSLLDYYCFSYLCCHLDGLAKNMLMVTYDGVIWGASLYDMDSIYGVSWNGASYVATNYQCPEQYQEQFSLLWQRIERCFGAELYARYLELRQGALSLSNIVKHVEEIYDVIPDRVFADEKAKWTGLPQVNTNTMTRFRNYMRDRAVYVDAQMQEIGTPQSSVECTGITLDKDTLTLGAVEGGTTEKINLLTGVNSSINSSGNIVFNAITLEPGVYVITNINKGTFTWLGYTIGGVKKEPNTDSTKSTIFAIEEVTDVIISAYPNNSATNTADKLALYKYTAGTTQQFTRAGLGYFEKGTGNLIDSNNDEYSETISLDTAKEYVLQYIGSNDIRVGYLCMKTNNGTTNNPAKILPRQLVFQIENASSIAISVNTSLCGISDFRLIELNRAGGTSLINSYQLTATVTPTNCTDEVVWSVSPTGIVTVNNGLVTAVTNGETTVTATCGTQSATCAVTVSGMSESGGDTEPTSANLVFQVNSTSMNTADNTLTDNIAGISATLTGNPTVSGNQIAFTANDTFNFDISSLNLTSSNRTLRIKFTPTTLDSTARNVIGVGINGSNWDSMTSAYITNSKLLLQHGNNDFASNTVGGSTGAYNTSRLPASPVTGQEYELVISENINGNVRWFVNGTLVQNGTTTLFDLLCLSNIESPNRFIGSYSLIEIYNGYCNDYTEFTNMVNNA